MHSRIIVLLEVDKRTDGPAGSKRFDRPDTALKNVAACRWIAAVNHWGVLGRWEYLIVHDPQKVAARLREFVSGCAAVPALA